jgi:hypothetical protein
MHLSLKIKKTQCQRIDAAKKAGKYLGRKTVNLLLHFSIERLDKLLFSIEKQRFL